MSDTMKERPDLFNPVWINFTLVFCLAIVINISNYLKSGDKKDYQYDFSIVPIACSFVFGFAIFVPIIASLTLCLTGNSPSFKQFISIGSIYSYSNIYFILASFLTLVPLNYIEIIAWVVAGLSSLVFIDRNYKHMFQELGDKSKVSAMFVINALQILMIAAIVWYFLRE